MRKQIATLFNLSGIALLLIAGLVAWNQYNPAASVPPADVTIIDERTPPLALPQVAAAARQSNDTSAPAILPETKIVATNSILAFHVPEPRHDDAPSLADRKSNYTAIAKSRAELFPPPAQQAPTRLTIPALNLDSEVIGVGWKVTQQNGQTVSEWEVADYAVGYHKNSALPGAAGNTVMAGHNNIKGEVFRDLINLKVGDEIFVFADERTYRYTVAQKLLVKEAGIPMEQRIQNAQWIAPTDDVRLTLVSCWPYNNNTHRVIIVAKPAQPPF